MGTTPNGLPYPESTEDLRDGAAAIQALAEAVDARLTHMESGVVRMEGSANVTRSEPVTFARAYDAPPRVTLQSLAGTTNAGTTNTEIWPTDITTTGFTANLNRSNSTGVNLQWIATPAT